MKLLRGLFDAGYMEDWTYHETLSGVPQGGVVSPVLSNILLDKLDTFVENVLIPQYTKGVKKKANREYHKLMKLSQRLRRKGNIEEAERLRNEAQKLPSTVTDDPDYRRLNYVRYADDVRHLTQCVIPLEERRSSEEMTSGSLNLPGGESQRGN
jgi:retron-type reverse transcriptase